MVLQAERRGRSSGSRAERQSTVVTRPVREKESSFPAYSKLHERSERIIWTAQTNCICSTQKIILHHHHHHHHHPPPQLLNSSRFPPPHGQHPQLLNSSRFPPPRGQQQSLVAAALHSDKTTMKSPPFAALLSTLWRGGPRKGTIAWLSCRGMLLRFSVFLLFRGWSDEGGAIRGRSDGNSPR